MSLTITYTNENSEVKTQNSQGNISLVLAYNGKPYDLHVIDDNNLRVRIGNEEGYIDDININTAALDDDQKYRGAFTIPLSDPLIQKLPPGIYYLEVWVNSKDQNNNNQQLIFPSEDTLPFTLTPNIVDGSNSLPMITFDRVRQAWEDFKNFILDHQATIEDDLATFDGVTDSFVDKVDNGISGYQGFVSQAGSQLDSLANSGKANIAQGVNNANSNVANINSQVDSAKTQISTAANGVYSVVDSDVNSAESAINNTTASNKSETTSTVNSAENIINNAANGVVSGVNGTVNSAMTRIGNATDGIRGQVEGIVASGDNRINNTASGIESITSSAVSNASYVSTSLNSVADSAVANVNRTVNSADNNMSAFASDINDRTSSADQHIDNDVSDAESNVDSTVASADTNMSNFASDINDRTDSADKHIDSDVASADSHIDNDVARGDDHIDNTVSNGDSHIGSNVVSAEARINDTARNANDNTTNIAQNNISLVSSTTSSADSHISSNVSSGEIRINGDVADGENSIDNTASSANSNVTSVTDSAVNHVDQDKSDIDNHMNSLFSTDDTKTASVVSHIDSDATSVTYLASAYSDDMASQGSSAYNNIDDSAASAYNAEDYSARSAYSNISNLASSAYINIDGYNSSASTAISGDTSSGVSVINSNFSNASSAIQYAVDHSDKLIEADITDGVKSSVSNEFNSQAKSIQAQVEQTSGDVVTIDSNVISLSNSTGSMAINVVNQANQYTNEKADSVLNTANQQTTSKASDLQNQISSVNDTTSDVATSAANRDNDLQNQINSRPNWDDENWTRNQVAPSLANSAKADANAHADQVATSAINQANTNMETNRSSLSSRDDNMQAQITQNKNDILANVLVQSIDVPNDMNDLSTTGYYTFNTWYKHPNHSAETSGDTPVIKVMKFDSTAIVQYWYSSWSDGIYLRHFNTNDWTKWNRFDNNNDLQNQINDNKNNILNNALMNKGNIDHKDINDIKITGIYKFNNNSSVNWHDNNLNKDGNKSGEVIVLSDGYDIWQYAYIGAVGIFTRNNPYGIWGNWIRINNNDNLQNQINQNKNSISSNHNNLQDQINDRPTWSDENWTRSSANQAATNALNQANANMNNLPHWVDENWTRNNVAPSLADSAKNAAIGTANGNMETNRVNLQNQITGNYNNDLAYKGNANMWDWNSMNNTGIYGLDGSQRPWNTPYNDNQPKYGVLIVIPNGNPSWGQRIQIFYDNNGANGNNPTMSWRILGGAVNNTWHVNASMSDITNLQNQINNRPQWVDENWTRNNVVPNVANQAATNALNQANAHTDSAIGNINGAKDLPNNINDFNKIITPGTYKLTGQVLSNDPTGLNSSYTGALIVTDLGNNCVSQKYICTSTLLSSYVKSGYQSADPDEILGDVGGIATRVTSTNTKDQVSSWTISTDEKELSIYHSTNINGNSVDLNHIIRGKTEFIVFNDSANSDPTKQTSIYNSPTSGSYVLFLDTYTDDTFLGLPMVGYQKAVVQPYTATTENTNGTNSYKITGFNGTPTVYTRGMYFNYDNKSTTSFDSVVNFSGWQQQGW